LLRKLLDRDTRFVFYPMADAGERWYELGVTVDGQVPGCGADAEKSGYFPKGEPE
jgi:hypothetical protein